PPAPPPRPAAASPPRAPAPAPPAPSAPRDEAWVAQWGRGLASLLLTGLVVEAALMPIAAFHFHKAGAYGAAANIVAIPLTTFVVMPAE
ncbi:ComEC/Rec2 family competence protein, partial [Sphingomonas sp. CCH9-F2]|uniref:ComEC/Rec2 family competence protein n=1 Tax=Sphingomonas sp. CCH9-F2 TaxID=1768778 RepID=UPI0018D2053C